MDISIEKVNFEKSAAMLFVLYKKVFIEDYHTRMEDIAPFISHYKNCSAFISYEKSYPIGFLIFEEKVSYFQIWEFGVLPEYQKRGIGKMLMQKFLKEIKNKEARLITNPHNSPAVIFYLKQGFEISEWIDNYYEGKPFILLKRE